MKKKPINLMLDSFSSKLLLLTGILWLGILTSLNAQNNYVYKGTVTDKQGETLPGVNIMIKGTTHGITSNIDGTFTLPAANSQETLVFTFIGKVKKEVVAKADVLLSVVLEDESVSEGNVYIQMVGPNGYVGPTYKEGWGFNPLTLSLVNALKTDPRYKYTVANIDSLKQAGVASYTARYQNTGYFIQKYAPLVANYSTHGGDAVINWPNNTIELRLADTYLMEAEALVRGGGDLGKAKYYLDQVRGRVGLGSIPPTLDNIYNERRLELATEGHRYFDLIRTGKAATVLAFKGFTAGKNELLPIPLTELANTKLVQNPNY